MVTFSQVTQTMNSFMTHNVNWQEELLPSARALAVLMAPQQDNKGF